MSLDPCPPEERLYAVVAGDGEPAETTHVQSCDRCQAGLRKLQSETTILRHVLPGSGDANEAATWPAVIGKFVIVGVWNETPGIVTYRGLHAVVRQEVLVQVAATPRGADPALEEAFRLAYAPWLHSRPHLAQVLDAGTYESRPFLVVRFDGGDRIDHLAASGGLDGATACRIYGQVAHALATKELPAHPQFTAASVALDENGNATIVDWAAAVALPVACGHATEISRGATVHTLAAEFCRMLLQTEGSSSNPLPVGSDLVERLAASGVAPHAALAVAKAVQACEPSPSLEELAATLLGATGRPIWQRLFGRS